MERRPRDHCLLNGTSFVAAEYGALLLAAACIHGVHGTPFRCMLRAEYRRKVHQEYPSLTADTMVLTLAQFIPLPVALWFICDHVRQSGREEGRRPAGPRKP